MPLPRLGKPPFLTAEDVKDSDILEIADEPYVVPAEQTKWGRPRGRAVVKLSDGELRTWTMNTTTWDRLLDAFSDKEAMWIGKRVKVRKETQTISGSDKEVLFGYPYKEPQQTLDADKPVDLSQENKQIVQALASMSPEQRKGLLEALQTGAGKKE